MSAHSTKSVSPCARVEMLVVATTPEMARSLATRARRQGRRLCSTRDHAVQLRNLVNRDAIVAGRPGEFRTFHVTC
jgi:hypothetical protein